ncbi:zinc finger protein 43-like [Contarinia nasturtii]|uniref:zinc finger protein 43-like n=1 Tax=Contarinia nasturtii TaxID=265458 RepID=UPI0012D4B730|nr:zinc finger protein 43-like [Contarinia nasturtii]
MLEQQFNEDGIGMVKIEPSFEDSLDGQPDFDESTELNDEITKKDSNLKDENRKVADKTQNLCQNRRQSSQAKQKKIDFEKIFSENKHRFDMSCDVCPKSFDSLDEAKTHYATAHDNPYGYIKCCNLKLNYRCVIKKHLDWHLEKFKCEQCGKVCREHQALKVHMKQHSDDAREQYICDLCKKRFTSKVGIRRHLHWHTENNKKTDDDQCRKFIADNFDLNCDQCSYVFTTFHDARRHYKDLHNEKKGYIKCCDIKLNEYWQVIDHYIGHRNPSHFKCEICNKCYADRKKFYLHKRRHNQASTMSFICDFCGKKFRSKETISRHFFAKHIDAEPTFECKICHKRFQLMSLLRNHHYAVHREKKEKLVCETCGKSFNVKANFDKHMLSHADKSQRLAQRKQCDHCGEWVMSKSGLYYHEIMHKSGVQKCNQCEMELPHKLALLAHIRKCHRELKHKCKFCDKSFDILSKLKEHEDGHTRQNVYPCKYCNRAFTVQCSRQTHERRNHPDEIRERKKMRKLLEFPAQANTFVQMSGKCCRLCSCTNASNYLDIFSDAGIEMNISKIIGEHFKHEVRESDTFPNYVCQSCWQTTDAFHELYEKSKLSMEKFLNPTIKLETNYWQSNNEVHYIEESQLLTDSVKLEPSIVDSDSNENDRIDLDENTNDENSNEENSNEESDENGMNEVDQDNSGFNKERPISKKKQQRTKRKSKALQFEKLFTENRQLFDMNCDFCETKFETLDDARQHYAKVHKNPKGYIKCCNIKLIYPCKVVQHLQRHLEPLKFKCTKCPKVYLTDRELAKHIDSRHKGAPIRKEKTVPCKICRKMFTTEQSLDYHMRRHQEKDESEDGQFVKFIAENFDMKCDHCDTVFSAFHDARRHYKEFHNDDKGYLKCCKVKLRELWHVRDHIRSHLDPECFKCNACGKSFSTGMMLTQHKRRHKLTLNKRFVCDYCGKLCRDKHAIIRHLFTNHVNSEPEYECDVCHKKFQLASLLKSHKYTVHREKKANQICYICGKGFYVKFHLDKHMLSHAEKSERLAESKQCEWCGEWLMTRSGIYYHQQKHTSGIQKCDECQAEFTNRVALLGHIRQYHREHKFKCTYCDKTFATNSKMKAHEESHTRHKVYQCRFCPRTFSVPSSRRTHTRRNHLEEIKRRKKTEDVTIAQKKLTVDN